MNESIVLIAVCLLFFSYMVIHFIEKRSMQRTIDRLTDKLMAKDYGEYKRHEKTLMQEETPKRKPMSFYDDSHLEVDEVRG